MAKKKKVAKSKKKVVARSGRRVSDREIQTLRSRLEEAQECVADSVLLLRSVQAELAASHRLLEGARGA